MKNEGTSTFQESAVELQNELESWYHLLNKFQEYQDEELEYDIEAAGDEGDIYLMILEELQDQAAKSIVAIKERAVSEEGVAVSVRELRKLKLMIRKTLKERERLRSIGTETLYKWINQSLLN